MPTPTPAPCAGLGVVVGVGVGPVLVVPDAGGVDGVGEEDGETGGTTDAVGVGVAVGFGLDDAEWVDVLVVGRVDPDVDAVAGARDVVGVVFAVWRPLVGAGDWVTPGEGVLAGPPAFIAAITLPTMTSSTRATRAIRGSEAERRRRRRGPVPGAPVSGPPGPPGIGRGAVAGRWKRSGPPGGVAPASRAPFAAAVPGAGTAPLGGTGAPGKGVVGQGAGVAGLA
jgi:hypothetical protein